MIRAEYKRYSQMHRWYEVVDSHDMKNGGGRIVCWAPWLQSPDRRSRRRVCCVVAQELTPICAQRRIPVSVLYDEISHHKSGESPAQTLGEVRLNHVSCEREIGRFELP